MRVGERVCQCDEHAQQFALVVAADNSRAQLPPRARCRWCSPQAFRYETPNKYQLVIPARTGSDGFKKLQKHRLRLALE